MDCLCMKINIEKYGMYFVITRKAYISGESSQKSIVAFIGSMYICAILCFTCVLYVYIHIKKETSSREYFNMDCARILYIVTYFFVH